MEDKSFIYKIDVLLLSTCFSYEFCNENIYEFDKKLINAHNAILKMYKDGFTDLYFENFNELCFYECVTGKAFYPHYTGNDSEVYYFNKETGLYLNPKHLVKSSAYEISDKAFNIKYIRNLDMLYKSFIQVEQMDNELIGKAHMFLLKQGTNMVK